MKEDELSLFKIFKGKKNENNFKKNENNKLKKKDDLEENEHNLSEDKSILADFKLDFKKIFSFLKKHSTIFLVLIPIFLSIYLRAMPSYLPIAEEWAQRSIEQNIKNNILTQLSQQYPNLPQQNLMPLVEEQYKAVYVQQKNAIDNAVLQNANFIRDYFRDNKGDFYLGDIDSYYWLRYARNIVEKGHIEDKKIDGRLIDDHMTAPIGFDVFVNIYPYIIAYVHKFLSVFNKDISIMRASFYTPMFLSIMAAILAFLLGKKLSGNLAGLIASILVSVNPTLLSRTLGSDNDLVNIVFPFLILLFALYAIESKNNINKIIFSALSGLFIGVYSFAWTGWWYFFLILLGSSLIYLFYNLGYNYYGLIKRDEKNTKNQKSNIEISLKHINIENKNILSIGIFLLVFLISSYIGLSLFGNSNDILEAFTNPLKIITLKEAAKPNLWPNVYTTVAEMNEADFNEVISNLSGKEGKIFFLLAFLGAIFSLASFEEKNIKKSILYLSFSFIYFLILLNLATSLRPFVFMFLVSIPLIIGLLMSILFRYKIESLHSIILVLWFMATLYATSKGVRFILLVMPAFVFSLAVLFSEVYERISKYLSKVFDLNILIIKSLIFIITILFLINPIRTGYATAYNYVPSVNDAWVETLTKINLESKENAIINSWWDFGHWFKYFADRAVTFDGASQNEPQAHWIGKVLVTNKEEEAVSILRMLDCSANNAFIYINEKLNNTHESVKLIYKLLKLNKEEAKKELEKLNLFDTETKEKILNSMFCEPPENYFITSEDMVGKTPVWAHFGLWNFEKADYYIYYKTNNYNDFIKNVKEEYNISEQEAKKLYYEIASLTTDRQVNDWIAPWPAVVAETNCNLNQKENLLVCNIGLPNNQVIPLNINLTNMEAFVMSNKGILYPNSFGYVDTKKNDFVVKKANESELGYGAVLLQDNRTLLLMSEELVDSMFVRLFYFDGYGLKHFDKFHDVTDISGLRIITWKVEWDGKSEIK